MVHVTAVSFVYIYSLTILIKLEAVFYEGVHGYLRIVISYG